MNRLLVAAVVANALLVGAAGDQVIKQLPARHRIGVAAFSEYSQAADLSNGVPWYAALGVTAAVLVIVVAVIGLRRRPRRAGHAGPLAVALVCTVAHSAITAVAAPLNFSQRHVNNVAELTEIFDQFALLTIFRVVLQAAALTALIWVLLRDDRPTREDRTRSAP